MMVTSHVAFDYLWIRAALRRCFFHVPLRICKLLVMQQGKPRNTLIMFSGGIPTISNSSTAPRPHLPRAPDGHRQRLVRGECSCGSDSPITNALGFLLAFFCSASNRPDLICNKSSLSLLYGFTPFMRSSEPCSNCQHQASTARAAPAKPA